MFLNTLFQRSTAPLLSGWSGVENRGLQPRRARNSLVSWAVKLVPQSEHMTLGIPVLLKMVNSASQVAFADSDRKHTTSGQRVHKSITQSAYLWPLADGVSSGPITSMFTVWKGNSGVVSGVVGTRSVCLRSDLTWQPWQLEQCSLMSLSIPGQ